MSDVHVKGFKAGIELLPHQVIGRAWMRDRENTAKHRYGGILADEMGLGKTIQMIARIVEGQRRKDDGWAPTTLVVCPLPILDQWVSEINKVAVGLTTIQHHGSNRTTDPSTLCRAHIVITTYDTLRSEYTSMQESLKSETMWRDAEKSSNTDEDTDLTLYGSQRFKSNMSARSFTKSALFCVRWWRVVLDDAHVIRNRKTQRANACFNLECNFRWCLTGTPIHNKIGDLYSFLRFLRISPFDDWDTFNSVFGRSLPCDTLAMKRLQVVLQEIMLRRLKYDEIKGQPMLDLPERRLEMVECKFDAKEQEFYTALATRIHSAVQNRITDNQLELLLRLRQACNHPRLVLDAYAVDQEALEFGAVKISTSDPELIGEPSVGQKKCQMCRIVFTEKVAKGSGQCSACSKITSNIDIREDSSAKIRMILKLLRDIEARSGGREKTIVFSQFTSMLDIIEEFLDKNRIKFVRYNGKMNKNRRNQALQTIDRDDTVKCILVSLKAWGVGLNLTACNNIIHTDMWWNPALEEQAFDRIHRLGQKRRVHIYKLRVAGTVEDRILKLQKQKTELARDSLGGGMNMRLTSKELLALFKPWDVGNDRTA